VRSLRHLPIAVATIKPQIARLWLLTCKGEMKRTKR
jgi:hypothetical protein